MVNIRASSLGELFDCPARWQAKNLLKMRMPGNGKAHLGTSLHASTAAFDQAVLDGSPISIADSADVFIDTLRKPNEEIEWGEDNPKDAEKIGLVLNTRYCADISPRQQYAAVEVQCDKVAIKDLGITLTGTADRIRIVDGEYGISDLKSGGRAVGTDGRAVTSGHGAQLAIYEFLAEMTFKQPMTLPAEIIGLQTAKTTARVGVGHIPNVRQMLIGTEEDPGLLHHASAIIKSGAYYGNAKSMLCSAKFCPKHPTCKFKN